MTDQVSASSMTSVTETEASGAESDTGDSSLSSADSPVISSTDTDDKLAPLRGMSISTEVESKRYTHKVEGRVSSYGHLYHSQGAASQLQHPHLHHPYRWTPAQSSSIPVLQSFAQPSPFFPQAWLNTNNNTSCGKERTHLSENIPGGHTLVDEDASNVSEADSDMENDECIGDDGSCSSTDNDADSQTTSDIYPAGLKSSANCQSSNRKSRGWEPDMTSSEWWRAGCFSRYWHSYSLAQDWYRSHMAAIHRLCSNGTFSNTLSSTAAERSLSRKNRRRCSATLSKTARQSRRARRARNRRSAKARRAANKSQSEAGDEAGVDEDDETNMEMTDEMLDFFKTSIKHKMERDKTAPSDTKTGDNKDPETRVNIEDAHAPAPSSAPPQERPGARRTNELSQLYGVGAPMIHGMETALQMTFDRTHDKFQPKLWPNMPLKITFG